MNKSTFYDKYVQQKFEVDLSVSATNIKIYTSSFQTEILLSDVYSLEIKEDKTLVVRIGKDFPFSILEVKDLHTQEQILKHIPHLKPQKSMENKGYALILASWAVVLLLLVGGAYLALPWIGEKVATLMPKKTEIELGNKYFESFKATAKVDTAKTRLANKIFEIVNYKSEYPLHITVVDDSIKNAFAMPGGHIVVYTKIINDMKSAEEFVALIAHESTHVSKRHSTRAIGRNAAFSLMIYWLIGDFDMLSGISSQFLEMSYSRELETEADLVGMQLMVDNKINPQGMIELFHNLQKEETVMNGSMKYLSSHPLTNDRIEAAEKFIKSKKLSSVYLTPSVLQNWWADFYK